MIFGEVLFDRFPDGNAVLGGAPFNVAWHLQGFGSFPLLLSCVGDDDPGRTVRQAMSTWGMDTSGLHSVSTHQTGAVEITLSGKQHSFDILPDQAYDQLVITPSARDALAVCPLFYHGTLILRSEQVRGVVDEILSNNELNVFVDLNLRDPWWRQEDLATVLQRARWVKLNDEELEIVSGGLGLAGSDLPARADRLVSEFHLDFAVVTRGAAGAFCVQSGDASMVEAVPGAQLSIADTVGAGDAFSSVLLHGILRSWPLTLSMERAQEFAGMICQQRGATRMEGDPYRRLLQKWGDAYQSGC